jgi:hypothetical protein
MQNYRNLIEDARVIAPPNPEIVARIQKKNELSLYIASNDGKSLEFERDGIHLKYIFKYKGRWVITTNHAALRIVQRGQISLKGMEFFFRSMIKKYLSMGPKYTNLNNPEFLFFSKSLNQGMIIAYRKDKMKIDNQKHFVIVTIFPRGKKLAKPGTESILLETLYPGYEIIICD